ncbi:MAG: hypothetical protein WCA22_12620, partial [Candidatus Binatus sp.]
HESIVELLPRIQNIRRAIIAREACIDFLEIVGKAPKTITLFSLSQTKLGILRMKEMSSNQVLYVSADTHLVS